MADIRKLQRQGSTHLVAIPRVVMKRWEIANVRHVLIEDLGDHLEVRPLPYEQLVHYPRSEEEGLPDA